MANRWLRLIAVDCNRRRCSFMLSCNTLRRKKRTSQFALFTFFFLLRRNKNTRRAVKLEHEQFPLISNWKSPMNSFDCLFGHVLDFMQVAVASFSFFALLLSTYDIYKKALHINAPLANTPIFSKYNTHINIYYMAVAWLGMYTI